MNDRFEPVIQLIREAEGSSPTLDRPLGRRILNAASEAIASVLNDQTHSFTMMVKQQMEQELPECLGQEEFEKQWYYWLFWPMPGTGNEKRRGMWRTSLLLFVASQTPRGREAVVATFQTLFAESTQAESETNLQSIVEKFFPEVNDDLSTSFVRRLREAIEYLLSFQQTAQRLEVTNGCACVHGIKIKLSKLQVIYLEAFATRCGKPVTHEELRNLGIKAPADLKHDLVRKFAKNGIDIKIVTPPGDKSDRLIGLDKVTDKS